MPENDLSQGEKFQKRRIFRARWHKVLVAMASVVVFCTVYALILPAITQEKPTHTHTDGCYETRQTVTLACTAQAHTHTADCYNEDGELICGQADFLVHEHTESCYGADGSLLCPLPEIPEHTHTEECYTLVPHVHDESCYEWVQGDLLCPLEESEGHSHADDAPIEVLTCTLEENEEHTHSEACYEWQQPDCELEESEGHTHCATCYQWEEVLICDLPEEDWVLTCDLIEARLHSHEEDCYDEDGLLLCEETVVLSHEHGEDCFETQEEKVLTCTLEEYTPEYFCGQEPHTHTEDCYDAEGSLTCTLPVHIHTDDCREAPPEESAATEPTEVPEIFYCGREEHTHTDDCFDEDGVLLCTLGEHSHTERCREKILCCGQEEHTHGDACYGEDGALLCDLEEHTHTADCLYPVVLSAEESEALLAELTQAAEDLTPETLSEARELLQRLEEAYRQRWLTEEQYLALYTRVSALISDACATIAEPCYGSNWLLLRDSGWFQAYSGISLLSADGQSLSAAPMAALPEDTSASSVQIDKPGGSNTSEDGSVTVSKTIAGTELENVFDITLTVQTPQQIDQLITEPDMAVVIVMDISNTMKDNFGDTTRYAAAVEAADQFLDNFAANNSLGVSKVGYVAFNTDAHKIFDLSPCTTEAQANALKNTIRTETGEIINTGGYANSHSRFTNIEGGLKMAQDMLDGVSNQNKFIILLTDGFPTTYLESDYKGYDPYDTTGRFYDHVLNVPCSSGTSYSDEAAIRARNMASSIKNSGTTIFSIGVDVGGQTIQKHIETSETLAKGEAKISVVDRTGTTYEIGDASSTESYKNWLKDKIGSGYYYDSTNAAGLKNAYTQIFEEIKTTVTTATDADWVASDPIPCASPDGEVEFLGLYDQKGELKGTLAGNHEVGAENTASYGEEKATITWDLKQSGYSSETSGGTTWYRYALRYRVRLKNEDSGFVENQVYNTNGETKLQYRVVQTVNGTASISEAKTIDFPIPSVHGYLGELTFTKMSNFNNPLSGAEFTLHHAETCDKCRGDGTRVEIEDQVATSGTMGDVKFENIPSGHTYSLKETKIPNGYASDGCHYTVTVAYDEVTVTVTDYAYKAKDWTGTIVNSTAYELPKTGGIGTAPYTLGGTTLILGALLLYKRKRRREEGTAS